MVFSSSLFLLYFLPFFLLVYYLADKKYRAGFLVAASTLFFAWGAPVFVFVVWGSILIDYLLNHWMDKKKGKQRKHLLLALLFYHIGLLIYFKYVNFFIGNANEVFQLLGMKAMSWTPVLLPLGISFIAFQKISYTIDVYRRQQQAAPSLTAYAYYILLFPKLLAGPIIRYRDLAPALDAPVEFIPYEDRISGFFRFSLGLAKKVLIANVLGETADTIFGLGPGALNAPLAWLGALAYTFQIYFDFSGYSDMAIGLAGMLGIRFEENFNNPYTARSITEFWRKWHITLSNFLRDYLFLPLAFSLSRKWKKPRYAGLKTEQWLYIVASGTTMLVCGFWHGAAWTFIAWGALQGLFMIMERLFLLKLYRKTSMLAGLVITFLVTVNGWVLFRSPGLASAADYLGTMWSFEGAASSFQPGTKFFAMLILAALGSFLALIPGIEAWQVRLLSPAKKSRRLIGLTLLSLILALIAMAAITSSGFSPFIYFRF